MTDPAKNPTAIARIEIHNRNEAFDAWRGKADRVDY
jgi:guanine deaminase